MALRGSPVPHWVNPAKAALPATRLSLVLDASGFWVLADGGFPNGVFVDDASGFTVIDDTKRVGLRPTLLPSGTVVTY